MTVKRVAVPCAVRAGLSCNLYAHSRTPVPDSIDHTRYNHRVQSQRDPAPRCSHDTGQAFTPAEVRKHCVLCTVRQTVRTSAVRWRGGAVACGAALGGGALSLTERVTWWSGACTALGLLRSNDKLVRAEGPESVNFE